MTEDDEFGSAFDEGVDMFSAFIDPREILAGSGHVSQFTLVDVKLAEKRLDLSGVLPKFTEWAIEDSVYRGGRPPVLNDRAIMIAVSMLGSEGSPIHIQQVANIFHFRLTDDARAYLGLPPGTQGRTENDQRNWYNRAARSLHRIVALIDAWPARRKLHTRLERIAVVEARISTLAKKNMLRRKAERAEWFTNAMLEMTFQAQPRALRRNARGGGFTVDQTALRAPSQRGPRKRDSAGIEMIKYLDHDSVEEVERHVLEIDADWYPKKDVKKGVTGGMEMVYMANIVMQVPKIPGTDPGHPLLALAASMDKPNKRVGEQTVRAMQSLRGRGHTITHLTADRGYTKQTVIEDFHLPLKLMGVPLVMDYGVTQLGVQNGDATTGAVQIEGRHYCPATPDELRTATQDLQLEKIDLETWEAHIAERKNYIVRNKEAADDEGFQIKMCPAYGPAATVTCPWREKHTKLSNRARPAVLAKNLPKAKALICKQASVTFKPDDGVKFEQHLYYGSIEHSMRYAHDRNTMEGFNSYLKLGPERIGESAGRRVRGHAAQQFIVTMNLVSANLRRIFSYIRDSQRLVPKDKRPLRRRDRDKLSDYVNKVKIKKTRPKVRLRPVVQQT